MDPRKCITTRLVTLHPGHNLNPTLVDARASVEDSPAELVQAVRALLGNRERKRKRLLFLTSGSFSPLGRVAFLQRAGYEVIVARTMGEVEEACRRTMFDLVVLGPGYTNFTKNNFFAVFREQHGPVKLLQIGTDKPHYTSYMSNEEVLARVQACLSSEKKEPPSGEGGTSSRRSSES